MARHPFRLLLFLLLALALGAACGGRTIEAGPGYGGDDGDGGAAAGGGTSTSSGTGGAGGTTSSGTGGTTSSGTGGAGGATSSGTGGTSPLDCIGCIMTSCPGAMDCVTDPNCIQGVVCAVSDCLGGGQPDLMCMVGCFNGDMSAALSAIDTIMCIMGDCSDQCGGMLPF